MLRMGLERRSASRKSPVLLHRRESSNLVYLATVTLLESRLVLALPAAADMMGMVISPRPWFFTDYNSIPS
jgi:hypothetical protein